MRRSLHLLTLVLFAWIAAPLAAQQPRAMIQGIVADVVKDEATPTGSFMMTVIPPNMSYSIYEGSFLTLPNFNEIKPKFAGQMYGFDLAMALRHDNYAMLFDSYLKIDKEGTYRFFLTSDDGSRLSIAGKVVANNDGVHAPLTRTGEARLTPGVHKLQVAYFQFFGGTELRLEFEGPNMAKQDIMPYLYLTPDAKATQQQKLTFLVNEATQFETVRGTERKKTSFLREHKGERVDVLPVPKSNPAIAGKVEILLPLSAPPLPPHIKAHTAPARPVFGTVIEFLTATPDAKSNSITIRLHEPSLPVLGVVAEVSMSQDKEIGYVVVKTDGKDVKFTMPAGGRVFKSKGFEQKLGSFQSIEPGQTVLVYPLPHDPNVCTKVDIMENPAEAIHRGRHHHRHHHATFLTTLETTYVRTREGQTVPAGPASVQIGEEVGIWPTVKNSHVARKVDVFLPRIIQGVVTGVTSNSISIKDGTFYRTVPATADTAVEILENKVRTPAQQSALAVGERVTIIPASAAPHAAEKVVINFQRYTVNGQLVKVGDGTIVAQVRYPAEGANPAREAQDTFQITAATKYEFIKGTTTEPATVAALSGAKDIVIYAKNLVPPLAEKISIVVPQTKVVMFKGTITSIAGNSITVKGHPPEKKGKPVAADTVETFQVNPTTTFEVHQAKKMKAAGTIASLQVGREVLIQGNSGPPQAAERIEVFAGAAKAVNVTGTIVAVGNGVIQINAKDGMHIFQLTPTTKIETQKGKVVQAADVTFLQVGRTVVIHGRTEGANQIAEKIDVKVNKK